MKQTLDSEIKGKRRMYNADFFSKHLHGLIKFTTHFGHEKLQEKWAMILKMTTKSIFLEKAQSSLYDYQV